MASEYWDTCLFLAYLQDKPEERELVEIIAAAEVLWDLFHTNRPYLKMVALSPRIAELAGVIGSGHRITSPDAVHVATAWSERVDVMLTQDGAADREGGVQANSSSMTAK